MTKLAYLGVALGACFFGGTAVLAQPANSDVVVQVQRQADTDRVVVPTADLKLDTAAGRRALLQRVGFAIESLCGGVNLSDPTFSLKCGNSAYASVQPQLAAYSLR